MKRSLTAVALAGFVVLFAGLAAGCGGSSETTESSPPGSSQPNAGSPSASGSQPPATTPSQGGGLNEGGSSEGGSNEGGTNPSAPSTSGSGSPGYKPDRSLQTFGSEVSGAEKAEVARDLTAFLRALASQNYTKVCAGITEKNREALQLFLKAKHQQGMSCATFLPTLLHPNSETRRAAHSTVTHVRIKGKDAIVFFRPRGEKVRYIAMTREGGDWKSLTLAPGTPLNPLGP